MKKYEINKILTNVAVGILVILFNLSCMKKASDKIEYGPEVSKDKMVSAIRKIQDVNTGPLNILQGEFIQKDSTRVIRGRSVIDILKTVGLTVVTKDELSNQVKLRLVEKQITYDLNEKGPPEEVLREFSECLNKVTGKAEACEVLLPTPTPTPTPAPTPIVAQYLSSDEIHIMNDSAEKILSSGYFKNLLLSPTADEDTGEETKKVKKVTFHKLIEVTRTDDPPQLVKNQTNCGGIVNCKIKINEVQFDQVYWFTDDTSEKIHVKLVSSPDVPYLANPLEDCQQGSVVVQSTSADPKNQPRVLVTFCESIRNFQKGE